MELLFKQGFRIYLGVTPAISSWNPSYDECSLILDANPLIEFVEMPSDMHPGLNYSQLLCGAIRGALEMVSFI